MVILKKKSDYEILKKSKLFNKKFYYKNNIEIKNTNSVLNSQLEVSKNGAKEFYRIK